MALNGQEIEGNPFAATLNHPIFGPVWDFNRDLPLTHGDSYHNCRCQIESYAIVHWSEIEPIANLCQTVKVNPGVEMIRLPDTLAEIRSQLGEMKDEISSLTMNYHELRELETILMRTLIIMERSTGSKEVKQAIDAIQRLISIIRMAQFTLHAFEAASGPIGWAFAISGLAMTAITAASSLQVTNG